MSIKITTPGFVRGNVFWVTPPDDVIGSEKEKVRPGVIISSDRGNSTSSTLTVLLFTTAVKRALSVNVEVHKFVDCAQNTVLCNHCHTWDKSRFGDYIGRLTDVEMARVERAFCEANGISHWGGTVEKLQEDKERQALVFAEHKQKLEADLLEKDKEIQQLKEQIAQWELADQRKAGTIAAMTSQLFEADVKELLYQKAVEEVAALRWARSEEPAKKVEEEPKWLPACEQKVVPQGMININECESKALRALGMSQTAASEIVSHRKKYGDYEHIEDLLNLKYFGKQMMAKYGGFLTV